MDPSGVLKESEQRSEEENMEASENDGAGVFGPLTFMFHDPDELGRDEPTDSDAA